ncbi:MAG TPA: glycoside hydrolase family 15 protein [Acidobacteriaceae bacterium]|nr:glycoside hydrolase family 15 protein [Acidobacteriaceae bacterium]
MAKRASGKSHESGTSVKAKGPGPAQGGARKAKRDQGHAHAARIEDYALIGDCETAALVSRSGSIDWLCWPSFSAPACFASLLGTRDHGFWKIAPAGAVKEVRRQYRKGTLVVDTYFRTARGEVCVTDFMPPRRKHSQLVRIVRGLRGAVRMRMDLAIRFDYGRTVPWVTSNGELRAVAGSDMVVLETRAKLIGQDHTTSSNFTVRKGQSERFVLTYSSSLEKIPPRTSADKALKDTEKFWRRWVKQNTYRGHYAEQVSRSLMTLKALTYKPTGGIVAAVTTSLPEQIGGSRNWDYRFCWLRDTAFTLLVLLRAGYREEALAWRRWLLRAVAGAPDQVQTIYGLSGERDLVEWEASWLPGYEKSQPVRIGNGASEQFQLDVFGEVASALARMPEAEEDIRMSSSAVLAALSDRLCDVWRQPDRGIWEVRGRERHFVHSKVMAWVALDRAIGMANLEHERAGGRRWSPDRARQIARWRKERDAIHREVCEKGFNRRLNSFVQSYGSTALDASCLRIALVGFLPPDDPRIRGTVEAIEAKLMRKGLVQRYNPRVAKDGLKGGEGEFLACSFWMVSNLWLIGRTREARAMFERLLGLCNDVGLLSEEYDSQRRRMVGNFPQALSHISLVHAAFTVSGEWSPRQANGATSRPSSKR